jgi:hypothetical protein
MPYIPPSLRKATADAKEDPPINLGTTNFPSLGKSPSSEQLTPKVTTNFKQTILNLIEKNQLDEAERNALPELDPRKMSKKQLEAAGWTSLSLSPESVISLVERFNQQKEPALEL